MNILMIDTSGPACGVAIVRDGKRVYEAALESGMTHSQRLMPMVDAALNMAGMTAQDIDLFGAVVGPGSFTGVRIGVSTVKALAHAAGKPCVGVDALEALAMNAGDFDGDQLKRATYFRENVFAKMQELRAVGDSMETETAADFWP